MGEFLFEIGETILEFVGHLLMIVFGVFVFLGGSGVMAIIILGLWRIIQALI